MPAVICQRAALPTSCISYSPRARTDSYSCDCFYVANRRRRKALTNCQRVSDAMYLLRKMDNSLWQHIYATLLAANDKYSHIANGMKPLNQKQTHIHTCTGIKCAARAASLSSSLAGQLSWSLQSRSVKCKVLDCH